MPDISMCKGVKLLKDGGDTCPHKDKCHRHLAMPDSRQSYFTGAPFDVATKECEYYWPIKLMRKTSGNEG